MTKTLVSFIVVFGPSATITADLRCWVQKNFVYENQYKLSRKASLKTIRKLTLSKVLKPVRSSIGQYIKLFAKKVLFF